MEDGLSKAGPLRYTATGTLSERDGIGIYRAVRNADGRAVIIKALDPRRRPARDLERLHDEYAIGRALDGPSTVRPIALDTYRDMPALVLEAFGGTFLDQQLEEAPLAVDRFLPLAVHISAAVEELHRRDVVHHDLRPDNIVVEPATGEVKLANFGVASRHPREAQLTQTSQVLAGSWPYMSPEQTGRMNRLVDNRSDLYSLGVIFYRLLTGRLPFVAADPLEWIHCHVARRVTPPHEVQPTIPPALSAIVMKLLAKVAEDRYQSAGGLRRDLERCLGAWHARRRIDAFTPGEDDVSERFRVPQQLYGREHERAALLAVFDDVVRSHTPALVLVRGYSGIGKSSLVHELQRPIVRERGFFLTGKFDQYQRDIPYATISQAFRALVRDILTESDERVAGWRARLEAALGLDVPLVVALIPELALILGEQPPAPELPLSEAQSRLHLVFRRLLAVVAGERPVALFLDDLQWVDAASLELLAHVITHPDTRDFLLIGAYRDHEVSASHPLMLALERVRKAGVAVHDIVLEPLAEEYLVTLVYDTFGGRIDDVSSLARLIHDKTAGNPFFAIQFLTTLVDEGLVALEPRSRRWRADLPRIRAKGFTDNVVELMAQSLRRLPAPTQEALRLAACLGNTVEVRLLAALAERREADLHVDLGPAVHAGLVLRGADVYRFAHDRIHEAAYAMTPEGERAALHLRLGRLMLGWLSREQQDARLFEIAGHFEPAGQLIDEPAERRQVAELHLAAGRKARASTAYAAAVRYFSAGAALLGDAWDSHYSLAFALSFGRAECAYLGGHGDAAEALFADLFARARTPRERAEIRRVEVDLYTSRQQLRTAVERGIDGLRLLGVELSGHPTPAQVQAEIDAIRAMLGERRIEDLIDLPPLTDPDMRAALGILAVLFGAILNTDPELAAHCYCRMVEISLRHGNGEASAIGYAYFGMMLGASRGRYQEGYEFGKLGYELAERQGLLTHRAKLNFIFGDCICFWTRHLRGALRYLEVAFQVALQTGDLTFACYCCNHWVVDLLVLGEPLERVDREAERRLEFTRKVDFDASTQALVAIQRLVRSLQGRTDDLASFSDAGFDDEAYEAEMAGYPWAIVTCWYFIMKLQGRYFAGDYAAAVRAGQRAAPLLWSTRSHVQEPEYWYYDALARVAHASAQPPAEAAGVLAELAGHEARLREWAAACPENFAHKHSLVLAELARLAGRDHEALLGYDRAIRSARENGFIHDEALAHELLARHCEDRGLRTLAETHARAARSGYVKWGAHAKVRQLDRRYPPPFAAPAGDESLEAVAAGHLDLLAVAKASQSISSEIVHADLQRRLLTVMLEQSGAQTARLIRVRQGQLTIEADASLDEQGALAATSAESPRPPAELVPTSVVHYVHRTGERVLLDDARADPGRFALDEYITRQRPRSLLCLPIRRRGAEHDVLCLENRLVSGAFRGERLTVLELLAAQATISLENAELLAQEQTARRSAEAAHRRASFLAEAGKLLGESLDYHAVLRRLIELCVRQFSDWCMIDLLEDGVIRRMAAHADPSKAALTEQLERLYPPRLDSPHPSAQVIRTGEPMHISEVTDAHLQRYGEDAEHSRLVRELGLRSFMVVPLWAPRGIIGAISVGSAQPGVCYQTADLEFLGELARRAAMAIDNAKLYRQAQAALQLRDEFLSVASHELRTPMTSLSLALQTIARATPSGQPPSPQVVGKLIDQAIRQSKRMNRLIGELLDVSRIDTWQLPLHLEEVELCGLVHEIVARFQPDLARAGCRVAVQAEAPVVGRWDPSRLDQTIANVLSNAIKFGAGAPIEIAVDRVGDAARVAVTDHGIGVEAARQARIFERFERGVSAQHFGGLGLGLYIARGIAEAHGGSIAVRSAPGEGSTFTIALPCAGPPPAATTTREVES